MDRKKVNTFPFYRPRDGKVGDVMPCFMNGHFYIYYLRFSEFKDEAYNEWSVIETEDFVHYSEDRRIGIRGGTGCILYHDGLYHAFKQHENRAIAHYVGKTPYAFELVDTSLFSDDHIYVSWAWRDPKIYWIEEEQCFWMLLATNQKTGNSCERNACVAVCKSEDLYHWELAQPLFSPLAFEGTYECPDLVHIGNWYYLLYANANHNKKTHYVKSRSMYGPWEIPEDDTLDSFFWYAGRVACDGHRHIAVAWNPDRVGIDVAPQFGLRDVEKSVMQTTWNFSPLGYAGNMVFHQLAQAENGDLMTIPVPEMVAAFREKAKLVFQTLQGNNWALGEDSAYADSRGLYSSLLMNELPETFVLTCMIRAEGREVGFVLGADEAFTDHGCYLAIQPGRRRMMMRSGEREHGAWAGYCCPWETEAEKFIPGKDSVYDITLIAGGDCISLYVNGACMSLRYSRGCPGRLGLYAYNAVAEFSQIRLAGYLKQGSRSTV